MSATPSVTMEKLGETVMGPTSQAPLTVCKRYNPCEATTTPRYSRPLQQAEEGGGGSGDHDDDQERCSQHECDHGRNESGETCVDGEPWPVGEDLDRDQRREQRYRQQVSDPLHDRTLEHGSGDGQPGELQQVAADPGEDDRAPHHDGSLPSDGSATGVGPGRRPTRRKGATRRD